MFSFTHTDDQAELIKRARELASREFEPRNLEWRDTGKAPYENLERLREAGLFGLSVPKEYGGQGRSALDSLMVTEAIGEFCPSTAALLHVYDLGPSSVLHHLGTDEQKEKYLRPLMRAELRPTIAFTEPNAGSHATAMTTTAEVRGDTCVLNGEKKFCSNAHVAGLFFVYARFGPRNSDIGAVIVERDSPGLTIGEPQRYWHGVSWAPVYMDNCTVPVENIIPLKDGFKNLIKTYNMERVGAGIKALGTAECAKRIAFNHVVKREQFGQRLWDFQGVQWKFAEMQVRLESARLLCYRAAANAEDDRPSRMESSLAKVAATEAASFVCDQALQVCGATGMDDKSGLGWLYTMSRPYRIAGGPSEIHWNMIARELESKMASS